MPRLTTLVLLFLAIAVPIGCTTVRSTSYKADFNQFQRAESLMLSDHGPGVDTTEQRSATIKDFKLIAEVNAVFNSPNAHWLPVQGTPPVPRFTLSAFRDGHLADWLWFDVPAGKEGNVYVQMKFPRGLICFTYISQADFDKLMTLFGLPPWENGPEKQHDEVH